MHKKFSGEAAKQLLQALTAESDNEECPDCGEVHGSKENKKWKGHTDIEMAKLGDAYTEFMRKEEFKAGDFVTWKSGLKNCRIPAYGQPVVVMEVFAEPLIIHDNEECTGTPLFRELNDVTCGTFLEGKFCVFHYDSRRFMKMTLEEQKGE